MKKLSDNQFDELLRQKAESFDHDFDESAWEKMEQKLRKRDRVIFIRNSSFILILLLLSGGAFLLLDNNAANETIKVTKAIKQKAKAVTSGISEAIIELKPERDSFNIDSAQLSKRPNPSHKLVVVQKGQKDSITTIRTSVQPDANKMLTSIAQDSLNKYPTVAITPSEPLVTMSSSTDISNNDAEHSDTSASDKKEGIKSIKKKRFAFSITALAGPEFSSIKSIAGNKGTVTIGLLVNTSLSNKLTFSTGLKYGPKNYKATAYNYELQNPSRASQIAGIDASCNILEIPLQASYLLLENSKRKIAISSGLSSYLMLKEEYNFRYTPQSGRNDFLLIKNNANQHYLNVLSLSAIYQIKPKSSTVQWAIEPYVKLPLGGVGEGNVRLKSSGISLNLTYDLSKKNK